MPNYVVYDDQSDYIASEHANPMRLDRNLGAALQLAKYTAVVLCIDMAATAAYVGASFLAVESGGEDEPLAILWGDESEIGAETERRINHAIEKWRAGDPSRSVFCIGGARPRRGYFGSRVLAERFAAAGLPLDRLLSGSGSNDTTSNLSELEELANAAGVRSILVVTDRLQAMRIEWFLPKPHGLALEFSPYDYRTARPSVGIAELWARVHYEWAALASLMLPNLLRRTLIDRIRA